MQDKLRPPKVFNVVKKTSELAHFSPSREYSETVTDHRRYGGVPDEGLSWGSRKVFLATLAVCQRNWWGVGRMARAGAGGPLPGCSQFRLRQGAVEDGDKQRVEKDIRREN